MKKLEYSPPSEALRAARQRLGLTIAQAASAVGAHWYQWDRWESGTVTPRGVAEKLEAVEKYARRIKAG